MRIAQEGHVVTLINVFEATSEQQQLIDQWTRFTEEQVKGEPGLIGAVLHKSTDGTRVINYAQWRSEADLNCFINKYREQFAQWDQNARKTTLRKNSTI